MLQLLAEGKSNKEMAGYLNIGLKTVETNRRQLMEKLGIYNGGGVDQIRDPGGADVAGSV